MRFQTLTIFLCFAFTISISQAYPTQNANALPSRDNSFSIRRVNGDNQERSKLVIRKNDDVRFDHHRKRASAEINTIPYHLERKRDGTSNGGSPKNPGENDDLPFIPRRKRGRHVLHPGAIPVITNGKGGDYKPHKPKSDLPPK